jgi:hypothetical protein
MVIAVWRRHKRPIRTAGKTQIRLGQGAHSLGTRVSPSQDKQIKMSLGEREADDGRMEMSLIGRRKGQSYRPTHPS